MIDRIKNWINGHKVLTVGPGHDPYQFKYLCQDCKTAFVVNEELCSECGSQRPFIREVGRYEWDEMQITFSDYTLPSITYTNMQWRPKLDQLLRQPSKPTRA